MQAKPFDVAVIGAGLIGLSTAMHLTAPAPRARIVVLEKDSTPAGQQSGHNSGVIHSGIYYRPGSFKARFSVRGHASMLRFCREHGVPTRAVGKLVVATTAEEVPRLRDLLERGRANGVAGLELVDRGRAAELEPHTRPVEALWVPGTSIVDFARVAEAMSGVLQEAGREIRLEAGVRQIRKTEEGYALETASGTVRARMLVNCAGLHSDLIARMAGIRPSLRIIPFRGEYYRLRSTRCGLVRGLIYPVPDPAFPFLGVHLTRTIGGFVDAGPNAVLALKREGYRRRAVSLGDVAGMLGFAGFWRLALREWRTGLGEIHRSLRKAAFLKQLQKLVPEIAGEDLEPGGAGVRAQAVGEDGSLLDDFRIETTPDAVHVLNAPSPGATCSLVIGEHIAGLVAERLSERG
jgi:L-2-hydroxyglutarate oxidase